MNPGHFPLLALLLFAPWFAIIATLFWTFPRTPRNARRRAFDLGALLLAFLSFVVSTWWAFHHADDTHNLWKQVFATSVGYGCFLAVMAIAFLVRKDWLRRA